MKTTTDALVEDLKVDDIVLSHGKSYKVTSVRPSTFEANSLRLDVVREDGSKSIWTSHKHTGVRIVRDDGVNAPSHVVVDTRDGYVFYRSIEMSGGEGFALESAIAYAKAHNAGLAPKDQTYRVYALSPVDVEV